MPIIYYDMNKQIESFYEKNAQMFKKPLEKIINKMLNDCRYINGESLERHNFGNNPVKLANLPTILNNKEYENELIKCLKNADIEDKCIIELLWGDIQLGKRVHACIIMWISTYILKRPVLYIFRNLKIDKLQLMDDISGVKDHDFNITYIRKIFEGFSEYIIEDWKQFKLPELKDIDNNDNLNKLSDKEKLDPKDILCCLMNHTQLEKINSKLTEYVKENNELINLTVITDESDLYAPSASNDNKNDKDIIDATKCEKLLATIYLKVRYVLHITGTAHSLLYNTTTRLNEGQCVQLKISKVHKMKRKVHKIKRKVNYYGLFNNNITYNTIDEWWNRKVPNTNKKYKYDIQEDYHWNINSIIRKIIGREGIKYNSLLISEEKLKKGQFQLVNNIMLDFIDVFLIVFHGKCLGLYIPSLYIDKLLEHSKTDKRLFKTDGIFKKKQFENTENMRKLPNDYYYIDINEKEFNIKQIYKLLSMLIKDKKVHCNTVITITGKYGERGYSFTSDDYDENSFHITDQYFPCHVKTKNCTDISQRLRIQGKYNDTPNLTLWTSSQLKDIMENFYIPFMKSIENEIMDCESYEDIRNLIEGIIDTGEEINFNYMKYIGPSKYKKNIKKEKSYDNKHKGYRLIKFNGLNEEQLSQWCYEHNLPPYGCINEIKNDLSETEFIERYGCRNYIVETKYGLNEYGLNEEELIYELKKIKLKHNWKGRKNENDEYICCLADETLKKWEYNDLYDKMKGYGDRSTHGLNNGLKSNKNHATRIWTGYDENHNPKFILKIGTILKGKILPKKSYKINKSYHIDETGKVFYSKLKSEYLNDENYEESPYYWKTPDGWIYLYDPKKLDILSITIKREEELQVQASNEPIEIDENIRKFKNECIGVTEQTNIRIGINILNKNYKDWCISKNIPQLTRKKVKEELIKLNIKEETSKGVDIDGRPGKRGYNIYIYNIL